MKYTQIIAFILLIAAFSAGAGEKQKPTDKSHVDTPGNWSFQKKIDPMTDRIDVSLVTVADQPIDDSLDFPALGVGCRGEAFQIFLVVGRRVSMEVQSIPVRVRWDSETPIRENWTSYGKALAIATSRDEARNFVKRLLGAERLVVEIPLRYKGPRMATFAVGGFREAMSQLANEGCAVPQ
jgi:hypothetical protein